MVINFKVLKLNNFKSHQDITVNFGERTDITGDNAKGKSSILEAVTWLLYGTDSLNSKIDPAPITYKAEETIVTLLLNIDGKDLLLSRAMKKGKVSYQVNEVPSKATDFNSIIEQLFEKELFFSLFNPNFFFTQHWEKQRGMLLKYVSAPLSKDILKHMSEEEATCLKPLLIKNSLENVQKIYVEKKKTFDKKYIQAQTRAKTLKEQLDQIHNNVPIESLKAELSQINSQVRKKEAELDIAWEKNQAFNKVQAELHKAIDIVKVSANNWPELRDEVIAEKCRTCDRPFDEKSIKAAKEDHERRMAEYKAHHNELVTQRNKIKASLNESEYIDVAELRAEIKKIDEAGQPLRVAIQNYTQFERLTEQVKEADQDEQETHKQLKEAIFIIDCVKAFKAKEAELQADKVQALFDTLSVRLFKQNKGDGELKPDFEIEMDGKPYRLLSLSESIRAGLELREVLSKQSELVMPVFVDNAESITKFKEPSGQLIVSRVVAGKELKVEVNNK